MGTGKVRLTEAQRRVLTLASGAEGVLHNRLDKRDRPVAMGLARRRAPLLDVTPFHLWRNPGGPTYQTNDAGKAALAASRDTEDHNV